MRCYDKVMKNEVENAVNRCPVWRKAYRPHKTVVATFTKTETDVDKLARAPGSLVNIGERDLKSSQ